MSGNMSGKKTGLAALKVIDAKVNKIGNMVQNMVTQQNTMIKSLKETSSLIDKMKHCDRLRDDILMKIVLLLTKTNEDIYPYDFDFNDTGGNETSTFSASSGSLGDNPTKKMPSDSEQPNAWERTNSTNSFVSNAFTEESDLFSSND